MMSDLVIWSCCVCGTQQAMPKDARLVFKATNQTFYCVHGHENYYPKGKTEAERLQEMLDAERRAKQRAEQQVAMFEDDAKRERRRANAYKGHATRITKRAKGGVCPCCNRTFAALAKHMATKHPQFTPIDVDQTPKETVQ